MNNSINLTDKAILKIKDIAKKESLDPIIRTGIKGGGCKGYQNELFFEKEQNIDETDQVFDFNGVKIVVDMMSITYLEGTTIDYIDGLTNSGFKFLNGKQKATCGCGKSFSM